jgi:hypothetical protein
MSNDKKQTPVEWLIEQFYNNEGMLTTKKLLKAKEMEKEQTINFTEDWYFNGPYLGEGIDVKNTIEQHFNKTYGGGEQ